MVRSVAVDDPILGKLTDDLLTRDVRVFQRLKGHRFSSDDVVTAYVAYAARPQARRVLDLGCGLGSVLLQLAWKLPGASLAGIEAQEASFQLLQRNVQRSGYADRVRIQHGDLRDAALLERLGASFDLVTGTPPYFPPAAALAAEDRQRALARVEYRGGIDAYVAAGAGRLAPDGALVLCGDARSAPRVTEAAASAELFVRARRDVIARAGSPPLFSVWTLGFAAGAARVESMTLRDAEGKPTADARRLREFSGLGTAGVTA